MELQEHMVSFILSLQRYARWRESYMHMPKTSSIPQTSSLPTLVADWTVLEAEGDNIFECSVTVGKKSQNLLVASTTVKMPPKI